VIERSEPDFVDNDEVVSADLLDGFPDGVIRDSAVEMLNEIDRGEVTDSVAGGDCCPSETNQVVTFPGSCWPDEGTDLWRRRSIPGW
jgi:hypothetical protein